MNKTIGLVLKRGAPEALEAVRVAREVVPDARFVIEAQGPHALAEDLDGVEKVEASTFESVDLVLVLGGDGTLIHAASLLKENVVPILGINLGRLGFLADVTSDELPKALPGALDGSLPHLDRMRLDVEIRSGDQVVFKRRILNDAVVNQPGLARIAEYRVELGGEHVTSLRADGVIVATPTGSTAYSMAAGGSILAPALEGIAITPICPHAVTQRPLVVAPEGEIVITLESEREVFASLDGQTGQMIRRGESMLVRRAPVSTRFVCVPWRGYFQTLRAKLRWGEA